MTLRNKIICLYFLLVTGIVHAGIQTKAVIIDKTLVQKLSKLKPASSNAGELEKILGSPAACMPGAVSMESWSCQWKGNLQENGIKNTLNVFFEAGAITRVRAIDKEGNFL